MRVLFSLVNTFLRLYIEGMTEASQKVQAWLEGPPPRSQAALARLAEIPATTVRNILAGHGATAMTIEKLRSVRGLGDLQAKHFTNGRAA